MIENDREGRNIFRSILNTLMFTFYYKLIMNKNCHSPRISSDIDIELGPLTKLTKKNTKTSKSIDDDVMSANYNITTIFLIDS